MQLRKRVYVAGPIKKGDLCHNIRQADDALLALMKAGFAVFNPMLSCYAGGAKVWHRDPFYTPPGQEPDFVYAVGDHQARGGFRDLPYEDWYEQDLAWVAVSNAVLRLPGESTGADKEVEFATANGIPVFHDLKELIECLRTADNPVVG